MKKRLSLSITLAVIMTATHAYSQAKGDAAAGKVKYDQLCASCHGVSGKGDGAAAAAITPKPRNFADKTYMSGRTDADLVKVIKSGGPAAGLSAMMPPWGSSMSDADITNVVAHIRTMAK